MPSTPEQRAAKRAAETPAQREERRAKYRARYRAKRQKLPPSAKRIMARAKAEPPPPPPAPIVGIIDAALAAPVPSVGQLATRELYADAVNELTTRLRWRGGPGLPPLQVVLWKTTDSEIVRCHRLAAGLLPESVMRGDHIRRDRAWLREIGATVCLAALGECDWADASPCDRAAFLLGRIVDARR